MNIEDMKARVYFLAGQLEEAKKIYTDAVREVERANKEQAKQQPQTETMDTGKTIHVGDAA